MSTQHPVLHLGVLVQPYRAANGRKKIYATTTGDVAKILEERYGIMQTFYRVHREEFARAFENSIAGAIESMASGHRVDPFGPAVQTIQREFKHFISSGEAERVILPGGATGAALRGVSHRRKHPYAKRNPRRVSFRDTGLYMASFRAWVS